MHAHSRRAFLGLVQGAVATAAIGGLGVRLIENAEAMPAAPDLGQIGKPSHVVQAQWGPPAPGWGPGPGWGPAPGARHPFAGGGGGGFAGGIAAVAVADGDGSKSISVENATKSKI